MAEQNIVLEVQQFQHKWLLHLEKTDTNRIPK